MASDRKDIFHSLATMLRSGLPVLKALPLATQAARGSLRRALRDMTDAAAAGESLGSAMSRHPEAFTPLEMLVVDAAETSGRLPEAFAQLADYCAFRDRMRSIILSGLVLPIVILHIAAFVIPFPSFILGSVDLGGYLLQVLMPLLFLYVPAIAIFWVTHYAPRTGPARTMLDQFTLMLPILGHAVRHLSISRFCRAFQMLYATGSVPIAECIRKAAEASGNVVMQRRFAGGIQAAEAGSPVSEGFSPRLPVDFIATWRIAEESGTLDTSASRTADAEAADAERLFERVAVWTPRIVYALVSLYLIYNILSFYAGYIGQINKVSKEIENPF